MKHEARLLTLGAVALIGTLGGCARVPGHQGFLMDQVLVASVKPGVDNQRSVEGTLGRPTFVGQFDSKDWYYVSRETRSLAFRNPSPSDQTILHVRFDAAGNVASVDRTGLEKIASIRPDRDRTPTLGRNRSLLSEIFGNIGQVGSVGRGGATTDNPDGGN